jgi:hypothetical protein
VVGSGIWLSGGATATTIENNIVPVSAGPAIRVSPDSESGFASNYNLFDLTGSAVIANWEGADYASLVAWYFATGADQNSQVGNPDFVAPAGTDGVLGFAAQAGTPVVVTAPSRITGVWTPYQGGTGGAGTNVLQTAAGSAATATWAFTGLKAGTVYQVAVNWPSNNFAGTATFVVCDANGLVLADAAVNESQNVSTALTSGGAGFSVIGQITATTGGITVTINGDATDAVIADAVLVQAVGLNGGADDDFHQQAGSPAIDAGDPATPANLQPSVNSGRVNQGYDGDTTQAQTSAAETLQVLNPAPFGKYEVGEQVPISIDSNGLGSSQADLLVAAGSSPIVTATQGDWQGGAYQTSGGTFSNTSPTTGLSGIPDALFTNGAQANDSNPGTALDFALPATNGSYTLRLYFADPNSTAPGQDVFDVVVNGKTMVSEYDVFLAAGGQNMAVELDLAVTASGGKGIDLSLVSVAGQYGAFVNGIELDRAVASGVATPTAAIQLSTNDGQTWSTIASNVPINRFGQAQVLWTVNATSTGSTALIRVTSGKVTTTSQPFLLANGGTRFYVDDGSLAGNQYTTAIGNDANSGKSPAQPVAKVATQRVPDRTG